MCPSSHIMRNSAIMLTTDVRSDLLKIRQDSLGSQAQQMERQNLSKAALASQLELETRISRAYQQHKGSRPPHDVLSELLTDLSVEFVSYKGLVRENFVAMEQCRTQMQTKKREADERHLQLQNRLYEKDHLKRTILTVRDFLTHELDRIAEEEKGRLVELPVTEVVDDQTHQRNLLKLEHAKQERMKLHEEEQELQTRKAALASEIAALKDKLRVGIPKQIADLVSLCTSLKDQGPDLRLAEPHFGLTEEVLDLPKPLYVLLGLLVSYMRSATIKGIDRSESNPVNVVLADASELLASDKPPGLVLQSEHMAMDVEDRETHATEPICVHGKVVRLEVLHDLRGSIGGGEGRAGTAKDVVNFYYDTVDRYVFVHCPTRPRALVNLYANDRGEHLTNTILRRGYSVSRLSSGADDRPRAFMWAQYLAGNARYPLQEYRDYGLGYCSSTILNRLRSRLRTQVILDEMLAQLSAGPEPIPFNPTIATFPHMATADKGWELSEFREISADGPGTELFIGAQAGVLQEVDPGVQGEEAAHAAADAQGAEVNSDGVLPTSGPVDPIDDSWARDGARYFEAVFKREAQAADGAKREKPALVRAFVEVTPEYPLRPSRVEMLPMKRPSPVDFKTYQNLFSGIKVEVNANYDALVGDTPSGLDWLLPHQIRKVQFLLNSMDTASTSALNNVTTRMRYGAERRRAYNLDVQARLLLPR